MRSYTRPSIDALVFRDANGQVIDYGTRWHGSPPDDMYSVDTHPERFAPIHIVADTLIAHLRDTYDVELIEGHETAADLLRPAPEPVRAVRVRPNDPRCAALTFVFTAYPGLFLHAGQLHDFHYPVCGCEACDSTWEAEADALEQLVHAAVTGHYREGIDHSWVDLSCTYRDGGATSSRSSTNEFTAERLTSARRILGSLPDEGWAPWPEADVHIGGMLAS